VGAEPDESSYETEFGLAEIYAESICSPAAVPAFLVYCRQEAREVLTTYWTAVLAIAAALEAAGSITGEEIDVEIAEAVARKGVETEKARRATRRRWLSGPRSSFAIV
jgi:hypothetical protein